MKALASAAALLALVAVSAPARADGFELTGVLAPLSTAAAPSESRSSETTEPSREAGVSTSKRETTIFGLPKNVGTVDRVIRASIGAGLLATGVYGLASKDIDSTTSGILMGVSAVPFATAATGYCPLYHVVGIDYTF